MCIDMRWNILLIHSINQSILYILSGIYRFMEIFTSFPIYPLKSSMNKKKMSQFSESFVNISISRARFTQISLSFTSLMELFMLFKFSVSKNFFTRKTKKLKVTVITRVLFSFLKANFNYFTKILKESRKDLLLQ